MRRSSGPSWLQIALHHAPLGPFWRTVKNSAYRSDHAVTGRTCFLLRHDHGDHHLLEGGCTLDSTIQIAASETLEYSMRPFAKFTSARSRFAVCWAAEAIGIEPRQHDAAARNRPEHGQPSRILARVHPARS